MAVHDLARIEEKLDRVAVGNTPVSETMGGLSFTTMSEVIEFAKLMSLSGNAVPKHLQGNPGMCLAVCVQAMEWRFSPFSVANKSYEVQSRLCFESQLVHAVIEQRAPIIDRPRHKFDGEGDDRRCIVTATLRETNETLEYISPPFSKIQPKNSPLWKTKPDLQLYYNTSRDFCRAYFPDVLLGVYSAEELRDHVGPDNAKDVTKPDGSRLKGNKGRGFSATHVDRETRGVIDAKVADPAPPIDNHSSQPAASSDGAETDKPASELTSAPDAGTNAISSEGSPASDDGVQAGIDDKPGVGLPIGWQRIYAQSMTRESNKPKSLATRRTEALRLIEGTPSDEDRAEMQAIDDLARRRSNGELSTDEFNAQLREIAPAVVEI